MNQMKGNNGTNEKKNRNRPLDSGAASSAACRQGKKDIGRSRKKKETKEKKGKKEEEDKDDDLIRGEMMVEE